MDKTAELLGVFADATISWAQENPFLAMAVFSTLLWFAHEPITKPLLNLPATFVNSTIKPLSEDMTQWRTSLTQSTNMEERAFREDRRQGVAVGAMSSTIFVGIALLGMFLNYNLLSRPFRAMFSGTEDFVAGIPNYVLAAGAVLVLEFAAGVALMAALGLSNMIKLSSGEKRTSKAWAIGAALGMLVLTSGEVLLALEREKLIEQERRIELELNQQSMGPLPDASVSSDEVASPSVADPERQGLDRIPTIVQAILGFCVPWLLLLAVSPFETLIDALPILSKRLCILLLFLVSWPLMLIASIVVLACGIVEKVIEFAQKPAEVLFSGFARLGNRMFPSLLPPRR